MSGADIEALRAEYEAMGRGHFFRAVHADFELKTPERGPQARKTHRGPEEARRAFEDFFEPFEEVVAEPRKFFERDDRIVVFLRLRSRPRGSSAVVEIRLGHLWTMRAGKPVGLEIFPEREKALEAADLVEQS
jgi:ketosteroid isomerase-like protein